MSNRPSNITISNFQVKHSFADGINLHGSFNDVFINSYLVESAGDDCVALWSYRDSLGNFTITNSEAKSCGYQGCFVAYGGTGPFTWRGNTCLGNGPTRAKCLWLDGDMFNGQFSPNTTVKFDDMLCTGRSGSQTCVERGHPEHPDPFCPQTCSSVQWGSCNPAPGTGSCLDHLKYAMNSEGLSCENATNEVRSQCPACHICSTRDC